MALSSTIMLSQSTLPSSGCNGEEIGSEVVNGVQDPSCNIGVSHNPPPQFYLRGRLSRRNKKRKNKDPNFPRPKWSGYIFFYIEEQAKFRSLYPRKRRNYTKIIAKSWNNLSPKKKMVYKNYAARDTERYEKEMKEYNERMMTTSSSN